MSNHLRLEAGFVVRKTASQFWTQLTCQCLALLYFEPPSTPDLFMQGAKATSDSGLAAALYQVKK